MSAPYTDLDLLYAATARCQVCGAGLAYAEKENHFGDSEFLGKGAWTCSAALKGEMSPTGHAGLPWNLYKVREETSINNREGFTTRQTGTRARTVGKATCPKCHHEWESEPYVACGQPHHWFSGACPGCGYAVGAGGVHRSSDGPAIETRYRHVVRPHLVGGFEETEYLGNPTGLDEIYPAPPVQVREERCVELQAEIDSMESRREQICLEVRQAEGSRKELLARLKQNAALSRIDDFLAGKLTWFVIDDHGTTSVAPASEALAQTDRVDREKMKLLTLFGATNGDLQWKINQYSDGSGGSSRLVYPFVSEEEARAFAVELVTEQLAQCIADPNKKGATSVVKSAASLGVPVPEVLAARLHAAAVKGLEKTIAEERARLEKREAELAALVAQGTAATSPDGGGR